eukprot:scaffold304444_cov31-Tisochrysis_lutea.AAC.1
MAPQPDITMAAAAHRTRAAFPTRSTSRPPSRVPTPPRRWASAGTVGPYVPGMRPTPRNEMQKPIVERRDVDLHTPFAWAVRCGARAGRQPPHLAAPDPSFAVGTECSPERRRCGGGRWACLRGKGAASREEPR